MKKMLIELCPFSVSLKSVWKAYPRSLSKPSFEISFTCPKWRFRKFSGITFQISKLLVSSISSEKNRWKNFRTFSSIVECSKKRLFLVFFVMFVHLNVDDWWNNAANQVFKGRLSGMSPGSSAYHVFNFRKTMGAIPIFLVILSHKTSCPVCIGHISIIPNTSSRHLTIWNVNGLLLLLLFFSVKGNKRTGINKF